MQNDKTSAVKRSCFWRQGTEQTHMPMDALELCSKLNALIIFSKLACFLPPALTTLSHTPYQGCLNNNIPNRQSYLKHLARSKNLST